MVHIIRRADGSIVEAYLDALTAFAVADGMRQASGDPRSVQVVAVPLFDLPKE